MIEDEGCLTPSVNKQDHSEGPEHAPVTLVEYGDYQCPYCEGAYRVVKELQRRMDGRLRFVFRNFPLVDAHPHAEEAAEAAEAAGAQGKFWEMHDMLYEHQQALDHAHLLQYARSLGLDTGRFGRELADHAYAQRIQEELESGIESGVPGTPTFFINGVRYDGSPDLRSMLEALQDAT